MKESQGAVLSSPANLEPGQYVSLRSLPDSEAYTYTVILSRSDTVTEVDTDDTAEKYLNLEIPRFRV